MHDHIVWEFNTPNYQVTASVYQEHGYQYGGDDENGETQAALDSGEFVAFTTVVRVIHRKTGLTIRRDDLGGSVYRCDNWREFFTNHRDRDPMRRNCTIMRAKRGENACICHYFPSMVSEAVHAAREALKDLAA